MIHIGVIIIIIIDESLMISLQINALRIRINKTQTSEQMQVM